MAARARVPAADAILTSRRRRDPGTRRARSRPDDAAAAAAAVRNDLLDTSTGASARRSPRSREAERVGFAVRRAEAAALALGLLARSSRPAYRPSAARPPRGARTARSRRSPARPRRPARRRGARARRERARGLPGRTALRAEQLRRAGQLERFLKLVPIEYGRGVRDGRVVARLRDPGGDHVPGRSRRRLPRSRADPAPPRPGRDAARSAPALDRLGDSSPPPAAARGRRRRTRLRRRPTRRSSCVDELYPQAWKEAAKTADFDVIAATLDRIEAAAAAGEWGRAEQARLEAYGVFELGPEQRLRGLAPSLFREIEGYFWYGAGGNAGLVQLIKRKAAAAEIAATRRALDAALSGRRGADRSGPAARGPRSSRTARSSSSARGSRRC